MCHDVTNPRLSFARDMHLHPSHHNPNRTTALNPAKSKLVSAPAAFFIFRSLSPNLFRNPTFALTLRHSTITVFGPG